VFTASHKWYADVILDYIDPTGELIQHRLYREHCIGTSDNVYIKDLRIFDDRELKDLILVDNAVYSFGSQLSCGIPILPFKHDKEDDEFTSLMDYIESIHDMPDYRVCNE
jgi:CTD small phosphatase-like protein 2